jgi:hypothetical protein
VASVDHRMVWRRARPGRAAILVPSPAGDWLPIAKRALCSLSLTWGGMGDILVPIGADSRPSPAFRAILRAHDPDYVAAYQATRTEIALADPSSYASWRAGRPAGADDSEADDSEDETTLRQQFEAEMSGLPGAWDPSAAIGFARSWCSPYPSPKGGYYPVASRSAALGRPLISLSVFPGLMDRPLDLDLGAFDPAFELMARMRIGSLAGAELPGTAALQLCTAEERDLPALSELACAKEVSHPPALDSNVRHLAELHSPEIPPTHGLDPLSPFRRTTHGMKWINFEVRATWVVVIGDTCEDFCFALACDRLFLGATWVPARLVNDPVLTDGLRALRVLLRDNATYGHQAFFTSLSLGTADVKQSRLAVLAMDTNAADRCSSVIPFASLKFGRPKRLADPGSLYLGETSTCYYDEDGSLNIATTLSTPIPDVARPARPTEVAWEIDVSIEGEQALPRSALASADLQASSFSAEIDVRAGTSGLSYHSHKISGGYLAGWILDQHLVRPVLRVPSAAMTIRWLGEAAGYAVRPSQTGRLNQIVIDMWGSLGAVAADLSGPVRALLDVLTPSDGMKDGPLPTSLVINRLPYITAGNAQDLLCLDEAGTRAELDRLLRLKVLRRGLVLRCARCNWLDWYAIDQIGQSFRCDRCDQDNFLEQARWRDPISEPQWYYDLDHAVREALKLDGHVPILALDRLRARHRDGFSFTTDFELIKDSTDHPPEIDFAVITDGRLILGEAKKNDRLASQRRDEERKLSRLYGAARDLTADDVCLATAAAVWDHGTAERANKALDKLGIGLIYEEGLSAARHE